MALSRTAEDEGLKAAATVIEDGIWQAARDLPSKKIPPTIRMFIRAGIAYVTAGGVGGHEAPNAWMFEEAGARHPLFGNRRHWYTQPYRPFMEIGAEKSMDEAADVYADVTIGIWAKESGYV
jgi:hypothetical protein